MAYIGKSIESGTFSVLDTSGNTYNGSNTTFSLGSQVGSPAQLLVSHDGVIQKPGTDYSLASGGTQITFSTAPASGASIFIVEISGAVGGPLASDLNGAELILDADGDTSITADTDDQIDVKIAGADDFQFTANTFTVASGSKISGGGALTINNASGDITIDSAGDILLDADDTDILLRDGGSTFGGFKQVSSGLQISGGTTPSIVIDANGHVTMPAQSAFLVKPSGNLSNVTGDGTNYDVVFATEIIDRNADFSSATFTAPVTGIYAFHAILEIEGVTDSHTQCVAFFPASNRTYYIKNDDGGNYHASGGLYMNFSAFIDMDANDTVTLQLDFRNGSKVVDISSNSFWGGYLVA
jgi:hypothetical protein